MPSITFANVFGQGIGTIESGLSVCLVSRYLVKPQITEPKFAHLIRFQVTVPVAHIRLFTVEESVGAAVVRCAGIGTGIGNACPSPPRARRSMCDLVISQR